MWQLSEILSFYHTASILKTVTLIFTHDIQQEKKPDQIYVKNWTDKMKTLFSRPTCDIYNENTDELSNLSQG